MLLKEVSHANQIYINLKKIVKYVFGTQFILNNFNIYVTLLWKLWYFFFRWWIESSKEHFRSFVYITNVFTVTFEFVIFIHKKYQVCYHTKQPYLTTIFWFES